MAKQFGVKEEALAGLEDPERHPFPPPERAALRFASAMTRGGGEVSDEVFEDLRRHFGEAEIVEIACVVGLFNYFNRFNNALHVPITLADPDLLVRRVERAAAEAASARSLCERVADILIQGRRYPWVAIDERAGEKIVERVARGPSPPAERPGPGSGRVVDIRHGRVVVGSIAAGGSEAESSGDEERALLERVAAILAPRLGAAADAD